MPEIQLETGISMHYLDPHPSGGVPVVLIHGLGSLAESWAVQMPALIEAGFRPLAIDCRGFGQTSYPGGKTSIKIMADDVAAFIRQMEIGPAHLVGISMGGTIALQLAADWPELTRSLMAISTFASLRPESAGQWLYFAYRTLLVHLIGLPQQARLVSRRMFPQPEQTELREILYRQILQANPKVYRAVLRALGTFDLRDRLNKMAVPTLVVSGENDSTVPLSNQHELAAGIPGAQQVMISHAGHAIIADQPEAFNREMVRFLKH